MLSTHISFIYRWHYIVLAADSAINWKTSLFSCIMLTGCLHCYNDTRVYWSEVTLYKWDFNTTFMGLNMHWGFINRYNNMKSITCFQWHISYDCHNKYRLLPCTALTDWSLSWGGTFLCEVWNERKLQWEQFSFMG